MKKTLLTVGLLSLVFVTETTFAGVAGLPAITLTKAAGGGATYSVSLQILAAMTALTLLPAVLMMMTCSRGLL